jgi:predicted amidohydrolase YtcJ
MCGSRETNLRRNKLFYNGPIHTQAGGFSVVDSMAVSGGVIIAVGKNLDKDSDFKSFQKIDLEGRAVIPGFTDSHTHFYFLAMSLDNVKLDGLKSLKEVLNRIKAHGRMLGRDEWLIGEGFSPDRWDEYIIPDKNMLDKVTGGRPAAIYSKDQHIMWVNSRALSLVGISTSTPDPEGGRIERLGGNEPSGILKGLPAYFPILKVHRKIDASKRLKLHRRALQMAYSKGITGVHSLDGPDAFDFFDEISDRGKMGLRISYYPPADFIPELIRAGVRFGYGNDYYRISGVKIFADGSLSSQSALCFHKYIGSKDNYGLEVKSRKEILSLIKQAAALNLPCAVHAIGDRAVANVLDCFEKAPPLKGAARHRIEHVQMIRRKDISRLKRLRITASMQPSHCPSDIKLVEKYWGKRGRNCFLFNTLLQSGVPLAFGSDAPIEPLGPIAGIDAAVNRKAPGHRNIFYPDERISIEDAVYAFTAGSAYAAGREFEQGYLLPGYRADFLILSDNLFRMPKSEIAGVEVAATFFDGCLVYKNKRYDLPF